MLETKNLCKTYKPKKGVPVLAVDHISLRFPEKGMVFLLGKSGSGKSTMLNLLGGLDQYDDGEIIIKGISSKDFTQQRFDSYRNTYVGFIFQEYNVLEEFSVGANIALALELQGKTATDAELNEILKAVDLEGFGDRKPNELSGGQKQRVAIARALVKNPEIIMADEPTGALDSNTGRQVLDTLKKLSAEKLVIVVSHDREYAEQYADRIIELADGKVIRDVESVHDEDGAEKSLVFRPASIEIPADYHLTEQDRIQINEYLDQLRTGASLMLPGTAQKFTETDDSKIPVQDGSDFNLIKSVLPMKSAFKIGASSLKHKRFRLVMTILLSVVAFTLFALVDTFSSYDHIRACTDSLIDSDINYLSVNKSRKMGSGGLEEWWSTYGLKISPKELEAFKTETGLDATGLYIPPDANLRFDEQFDLSYEFTKGSFNPNLEHFCGFAEITEESMNRMHYKLVCGSLPDGSKDEIAISAALCDTFQRAGYHEPVSEEERRSLRTSPKYQKITSPLEMVGKVIRLMGTDYTVSGVIDTGMDMERYESLRQDSERQSGEAEFVEYMLHSELTIEANYTMSGCAMVGAGKIAEMAAAQPHIYECNSRSDLSLSYDNRSNNLWASCWTQFITVLDQIPAEEIVWIDKPQTELADNEMIISLENFHIGTDSNAVHEGQKIIDDILEGKEELTKENLKAIIDSVSGGKWVLYNGWQDEWGNYQHTEDKNAKIVGCVRTDSAYKSACVVPQKYFANMVTDPEGLYDSALGAMPEDRADVEKFVRYCYRDGKDVTERYELNCPVTEELDTVNSVLKALAKVFFWIGLFFALFASLLMANFISTSIHYKRQEIGILRAIGSRSADVFRIFFSESFLIAAINFVLSAVFCAAAVIIINFLLRRKVNILITVLHFGVRQIILLILVSLAVAAIASFLPVRRIAKKRPIDAIRDK
ncbi:MAG: ATP-binding cassette domain-containing protein [Oscillospiraceae bacterium]|nr:ATP-binding cassette domain-containing protein [Oscillospiraceae bacterium]